ncbi:MAG TPA: DUF6285 domain-containing protein [Alphaproteobacteria bacterium]|nr:DUF6285 domain-containing protein [Alphaproteobacteria bacterium]
MNDRPNGAELLAAARVALLEELLTDLPEQRRYLARMVANAMAIAARELELGDGIDRAELTSLRRLFQDPEPDASEEMAARLEALNRRLCVEIRDGRFAGGAEEARLRDHLRRSLEARVAVSNPKALGR